MKKGIIWSIIISFLFSCATFLKDEDMVQLKGYENKIYVLKDDVGEGDRKLKKGQQIKVFIKTGKDSIKVYCYSSNVDFVKSERTLILYFFEDDFEGVFYDDLIFKEKLYDKIKPVNK